MPWQRLCEEKSPKETELTTRNKERERRVRRFRGEKEYAGGERLMERENTEGGSENNRHSQDERR